MARGSLLARKASVNAFSPVSGSSLQTNSKRVSLGFDSRADAGAGADADGSDAGGWT